MAGKAVYLLCLVFVPFVMLTLLVTGLAESDHGAENGKKKFWALDNIVEIQSENREGESFQFLTKANYVGAKANSPRVHGLLDAGSRSYVSTDSVTTTTKTAALISTPTAKSTTKTTTTTTTTTRPPPILINSVSTVIIEPFKQQRENPFYIGEYQLDPGEGHNEHLIYTKQGANITKLYVNEEGVWVFGNESMVDYIFKLDSSSQTPSEWDESVWTKSLSDYNETLTVKPRKENLFPPLRFELAPNVATDAPFYAGTYSLNLHERYPLNKDSMPQYSNEGEPNISVYVSSSKNQWVMGTNDHTDYIFELSESTGIESPLDWKGWHENNVNEGQWPVLKLEDPTRFPPKNLPILPHEPSQSSNPPWYAGEYKLNISHLHEGVPQYHRESKSEKEPPFRLFFNTSKGSYVFGDDSFKDYVFNMPESKDVSPSKWHNEDNSSGWKNLGSAEMPQLALYQPLSFPPCKFELSPQNKSDVTFYEGSFLLDLYEDPNSTHPKYIKENNDSIRLYLNKNDIWVLGDKDYKDFVYKLSESDNIAFSPSLWPEWNNTGPLETPTLVVKNASRLPPLFVYLRSDNYTSHLVAGQYKLNLRSVSKLVYEGENGRFLCMNNNQSLWILEDENHSYIFTMMDEPSVSPSTWHTYWQLTGSLEMPTLTLTDPTILPPKQLTLSPPDSYLTFYEGEYDYLTFNNSFPEYTNRENNSIHLYLNKENHWVLGDRNQSDFVFRLSKEAVFAPSLWPEWINKNLESPETPDLIPSNPTFLPPWFVTLAPEVEGDSPFYAGDYTLDLKNRYPYENGMPQYIKQQNKSRNIDAPIIRIYVNLTKSQWMMGNDNHTDFIFELSNSNDKESPLDWIGWHKANESLSGVPTLKLDNPTIFPPIVLPILPYQEEAVTLYAGNYELDMFHLHEGMPQYYKESKSEEPPFTLFFNTSKGSYVFGDDSHNNYIFKMPESKATSPSQWHEETNTSGWKNKGTTESPVLALHQPLSFPPCKFELIPQNKTDITFYAGSYHLDLYSEHNSRPQYTRAGNDNIHLYLNNDNTWVLGDDNYNDFVYKLSSAAYSPSLWPEWKPTGFLESPTLVVKDATLLPPLLVYIWSGEDLFSEVLTGNYKLNVYENNRLLYEDSVGKFIRMNNAGDSWILGDKEHSYIFTMMDESSASPATWDKYWDRIGSVEMPTLVLVDPTILPPKTLTLSPSEGADTFYAGEYQYSRTEFHDGFPQYVTSDNNSIVLYINNETEWVLGDANHNDSVSCQYVCQVDGDTDGSSIIVKM